MDNELSVVISIEPGTEGLSCRWETVLIETWYKETLFKRTPDFGIINFQEK